MVGEKVIEPGVRLILLNAREQDPVLRRLQQGLLFPGVKAPVKKVPLSQALRSESLETPYYNNGSMVRILGSDGYFYMRDASDTWGVRPVILLPADLSYQGSGTPADPFRIGYDAASQTHG